jgi:hypothetical protein
MEAQHLRLGILRAEMIAHDARPHPARRAKLRHLFQKIAVRIEEERQPWRELVDVETGVDGCLHIGHAVGQGECHFLHRRGSGLAHVIAGDGNRVPLGHMLVGIREDVGDDAHCLLPADKYTFRARCTLLAHRFAWCRKVCGVPSAALRSHDVQRQQNGSTGIDGHRSGDLGPG